MGILINSFLKNMLTSNRICNNWHYLEFFYCLYFHNVVCCFDESFVTCFIPFPMINFFYLYCLEIYDLRLLQSLSFAIEYLQGIVPYVHRLSGMFSFSSSL